jgi:hypothetical protein
MTHSMLRFIGVLSAFSISLIMQGQSGRPNRSGLIQSAIEHRWRDESKADQFTYTELWHNRNVDKFGQEIADESAKFESISFGGKPYLRMIEENGLPLEGRQAGNEEEGYRSSIAAGNGKSIEERITEIVSASVDLGLNLDLLPQYFDISVIGLNKVGGRDAFEYLCTPRTDIKPKNADKAGTQFSLRVWVDANDLAFSQVQAQLLADHNRILSGTTASISWVPAEGVWLPERMVIRGKAKRGRSTVGFETEYRFSDYKRFHSSSRIVGAALPLAPSALPQVDSQSTK